MLLNTVNENLLTSFPLYLISLLYTFMSLELLPVALLTGGAIFALLAVAGICTFTSYTAMKKQRQKEELNRQFLFFKAACVDELIKRESKNIDFDSPLVLKKLKYNPGVHLRDLNTALEKKKSLAPRIKKLLGSTLMLSTLLIQSYYLSTQVILATLGFTALAATLGGPIGLAVAGGIIVGMSLFLSFKSYQDAKENENQKRYDKALKHNIAAKIQLCQELRVIKQDQAQAKTLTKNNAEPELVKNKARLEAKNKHYKIFHQPIFFKHVHKKSQDKKRQLIVDESLDAGYTAQTMQN